MWQGLKPGLFLAAFCGTTEQLAEKVLNMGEIDEKQTSGAEARIDSIALTPGINPRPTLNASFSASCEVMPFYKADFDQAFAAA